MSIEIEGSMATARAFTEGEGFVVVVESTDSRKRAVARYERTDERSLKRACRGIFKRLNADPGMPELSFGEIYDSLVQLD